MTDSFEDFARANGLIVDHCYPTASIQKCPTVNRPKKKNGRYWTDGRRGWVQAHDMGTGVVWWNDPNAKPWTPQERVAFSAKQNARREEFIRKQKAAALEAARLMAKAKPLQHGYLRLKGFPDLRGLVIEETETLLVPMRDLRSNDLFGLQKITWIPEERRWEKKFIYGQRTKGCVFRMGPPKAREYILVEGYATGLSVLAACELAKIPAQVIVCFSDSNLASVGASGTSDIRVFADNDESGAGERAAKMTGKPYVMSDQVGEDANDLMYRKGVYALAAKLVELRRMPLVSA